MGRPTKLNADLQQRIVKFMGAGAYIETAAAAAGISKVTLYSWLHRGAAGEEPFAAFLNAVDVAQSEADLRDLAVIRKAAAEGTWAAAAWRLERRHPDQWGRRLVEVSGRDGGPIEHEDLTNVPTEALIAETEAILAQARNRAGSRGTLSAGSSEGGDCSETD